MAIREAKMGGYFLVQRGEKGSTGILGPCVGVIISDDRKDEGYVGHWFHNPNSNKRLEEFVSCAKQRFEANRSTVYMAGNALSLCPDQKRIELELRYKVMDVLDKAGYNNRIVRWSPGEPYCARMSIDTLTKEVLLEVLPLDGTPLYSGPISQAPNPLTPKGLFLNFS